MTRSQKWFECCYDEQSKGKTLRAILHVPVFLTEVDSIKRIPEENGLSKSNFQFSAVQSEPTKAT